MRLSSLSQCGLLLGLLSGSDARLGLLSHCGLLLGLLSGSDARELISI